MNARSWIVGSLPDCDIRVESPTVSGRHCRLAQHGEGFMIEDLHSSNGTFVGDERITGSCIVRRGDPVTLGRNTPLPWPALATSLSIGRLGDNDLVIPMDTISGHHARLEVDGSQVFLVDLGSTNGTAINDPLNKITRAALRPIDVVFLGTHRVAASDLLAALVADRPRHATVLEQQRPEQLEKGSPPRNVAAAPALADANSTPWPASMRSPSAWAWGIALSLVSLAVIFGGQRMLRTRGGGDAETTSTLPPTSQGDPEPPTAPSRDEPLGGGKTDADLKRAPPDEKVVRQSEEGVVLIGLRIDRQLALGAKSSDATWHNLAVGWACRPDAVICPTSVLDRLDNLRKKNGGGGESPVVCTPTQTIAVLSHKAGRGDADGFSVATLEAPLDGACGVPADAVASTPILGQKLALLSGSSKNDDPQTIVRRLLILTVDRVQRSQDKSPKMFHCRCLEKAGDTIGSPVFDASGRVVGCVQSAAQDIREIQVIPLARLTSLFKTSP